MGAHNQLSVRMSQTVQKSSDPHAYQHFDWPLLSKPANGDFCTFWRLSDTSELFGTILDVKNILNCPYSITSLNVGRLSNAKQSELQIDLIFRYVASNVRIKIHGLDSNSEVVISLKIPIRTAKHGLNY
jgi:hypothetical protein